MDTDRPSAAEPEPKIGTQDLWQGNDFGRGIRIVMFHPPVRLAAFPGQSLRCRIRWKSKNSSQRGKTHSNTISSASVSSVLLFMIVYAARANYFEPLWFTAEAGRAQRFSGRRSLCPSRLCGATGCILRLRLCLAGFIRGRTEWLRLRRPESFSETTP